jgi:hypothetical protein
MMYQAARESQEPPKEASSTSIVQSQSLSSSVAYERPTGATLEEAHDFLTAVFSLQNKVSTPPSLEVSSSSHEHPLRQGQYRLFDPLGWMGCGNGNGNNIGREGASDKKPAATPTVAVPPPATSSQNPTAELAKETATHITPTIALPAITVSRCTTSAKHNRKDTNVDKTTVTAATTKTSAYVGAGCKYPGSTSSMHMGVPMIPQALQIQQEPGPDPGKKMPLATRSDKATEIAVMNEDDRKPAATVPVLVPVSADRTTSTFETHQIKQETDAGPRKKLCLGIRADKAAENEEKCDPKPDALLSTNLRLFTNNLGTTTAVVTGPGKKRVRVNEVSEPVTVTSTASAQVLMEQQQSQQETDTGFIKKQRFDQKPAAVPMVTLPDGTKAPVLVEPQSQQETDADPRKRLRSAAATTASKMITKTAAGASKCRGRLCQHPEGCTKLAQGSTNFCSKHGGGKRCSFSDCPKGARGSSAFCRAHGGGPICTVKGCDKGAIGTSKLCRTHGGGSNCQHDGCTKASAGGSSKFCIKQ